MAAGSMVHCQLWMGGLEPYMTESFILASFERMGEKPLNVKVMRNKFTGEPAGYCFVHFENDDEAIDAMHKLNGKVIPNTNPPVRFRLNTATNQGKIMMGDREFSLWVGDLSPEVDDYTLYKTFAGKYQSLRAAKVILDHSGYSKGFGFLRFGSEDEQKHCLNHMNGYKNLGSKPIKISNAIPKTQRNSTSNGGQQQSQQSGGYQYPQDYSHYYDPNSYWQNYSQWGGYGYDPNTGYSYDPSSYAAAQQYGSTYQTQYGQYPPSSATGYSQQGGYGSYSGGPYSSYYPQPQGGTTAPPPSSMTSNSGTQPAHGSVSSAAVVDEANEIVEHSKKIDVEKENKEYAESILDHLADLASTTLVDRQLFQDEMYKLDIIDVSIPRLPAKLINQDEARRAVEAQEPFIQLDADLMGPLEASPDEGSEEPAEKKRKLSTHEESTKEAELEEVAKADETDKVPEETVVKVEQEDEETREKKAKQKEEWAQAKRFMAEVDVLPMMTETESVSSESTRISDDDIESLNGESKTESQAKETQIAGSANAMETDDGAADVRVEENAAENLRSENESTSERLGDSKYDPDDDSMEDADPETPAESTAAPTTSLQESTAAPSPQQSSRIDDTTEFHRVTRSGARKQAAPPIEEVQFVDETSQLSVTGEELDAEPIVDEDSLDDQPLSARLGSCDLQRSPTEEVIIEDCTDSRISGSGSVEDVNLRTTVISSDDSSSRGSVDASNLIGNLVNGEDDAESLQEETRDADSQDGSDSSED